MRQSGLLLLGLCVALAGSSANATALDEIQSCATQVAAAVHSVTGLEAQCPGVTAALTELGIPDQLGEGWRDSLDGSQLKDLGELARRYRPALQPRAPDIEGIAGILRQLAQERPPPPHTWWQRFKEWLHSLLENPQSSEESSWLAKWLAQHSLPAIVTDSLFYLLLGAIVIAAIVMVINELKASGVLVRGDAQARRVAASGAGAGVTTPALSFHDLEQADLHDQPALLLRLLVARLLAIGKLSVERNLTHRELIAANRLTDAAEREQFASVAQLAERVFYGERQVQPGPDLNALGQGRALLQQLDARGASA